MPLSENEQRQLEAIERALMADDPKFANTVRSSDLRSHTRRRVVRAALVFAVGFVLMLFTFSNPAIGIFGFVLMFIGLLLGVSSLKRLRAPVEMRFSRGGGPASRRVEKQGWRDRVEDRWKRRFPDRE